jgi:hypothetical protein
LTDGRETAGSSDAPSFAPGSSSVGDPNLQTIAQKLADINAGARHSEDLGGSQPLVPGARWRNRSPRWNRLFALAMTS